MQRTLDDCCLRSGAYQDSGIFSPENLCPLKHAVATINYYTVKSLRRDSHPCNANTRTSAGNGRAMNANQLHTRFVTLFNISRPSPELNAS
ncbi:hypothetical protein [uncultured Desulfobacter sp.]|uniref:hypothetical protein n=1 Tax=uncultured Desulfobacter sp. TaxID=240139 RepID=UPI002AA72FA3|nr:hypothetical protein [uncultured Desulfobacter sp.]